TLSVRDVAAPESARLILRKQSEFHVREPFADDERYPDAHGCDARQACLQFHDPHLADRRRDQRPLSLACGNHSKTYKSGGILMGCWFFFLTHPAGGSRAVPARKPDCGS